MGQARPRPAARVRSFPKYRRVNQVWSGGVRKITGRVGSGRLGSGRVASGSVTLARLYLREATQLLQGLDFFALLRVTEFKGAGRLGDRWAPLIDFHGTPRAPLACSRLFKRI